MTILVKEKNFFDWQRWGKRPRICGEIIRVIFLSYLRQWIILAFRRIESFAFSREKIIRRGGWNQRHIQKPGKHGAFFCKNSERLLFINQLRKKATSQMFYGTLNMPLIPSIFPDCFCVRIIQTSQFFSTLKLSTIPGATT